MEQQTLYLTASDLQEPDLDDILLGRYKSEEVIPVLVERVKSQLHGIEQLEEEHAGEIKDQYSEIHELTIQVEQLEDKLTDIIDTLEALRDQAVKLAEDSGLDANANIYAHIEDATDHITSHNKGE